MTRRPPSGYWNPYLAGIAVGLVLLAAFALSGRGLGASGAYTTLLSTAVGGIVPEHAAGNPVFSAHLQNEGRHPLGDWLVLEILGVALGGLLSGWLAGRLGWKIQRGPRIGASPRLLLAFAGGMMMGLAAKIARGCTSGQALSGGALLSLGGWVFMLALFAGAYALAAFLRRQWT